ncbi:MAG: hypothetical protein ACI4MI_04735 [Christensenellales bacterium]
MERQTCINKIKKYIPDDETKNFIFDNQFGKEDFLTTVQQIYKSYSNLLNLTFALIYAKYRKWKTSNVNLAPENLEKFNSYMRVSKTFTELYKENSLSFSTIEPTIMDTQLDIFYGGILSKDMGMCQYIKSDDGNRFAYFARCAERARRSSRLIDIKSDISNLYDDLIELLSLFPYLTDIELVKKPVSGSNFGDTYVFENSDRYEFDGINKVFIKIDGINNDEMLDTFFSIINIDDNYYYLQGAVVDSYDNSTDKNIIHLSYSQLGMEDTELYISVTAQKNFIGKDGELGIIGSNAIALIVRELRLNVTNDETSQILFRNFYAINYRYIKHLSMAIVDCLTDELRRRISRYYQMKHPELFFDNSWDNIMVTLLVKESSTSILQFLFLNSTELYDNLLYNLQTRFGSDIFDIECFKAETNNEVNSAFEHWSEQYFGDSASINEIINDVIEEQRINITAEVRALQLVSYLSKITYVDDTTDQRFKNKYPLNINSHIKMLELLRNNTELPLQRRKEKVKSIVLKTLKSLYIFYCGFFKYAKVKNDYISFSQGVIMTGKQVDEFQRKANNEFRAEVKKQTQKLSGQEYDVEKVLQEIEKLNNECIFASDETAKSKRNILKNSLGRYQLLDFSEINPLKDLVEFDNVDNVTLDAHISAILEIYNYLQVGKGNDKSLDAIYPYVGTFEYAQETRDGYKIAHFSISAPGTKKEWDIEMISEFQYSINNKYYCLPNKMCCNNEIKLWIEPTLIAYGNLEMLDEDN